MKEIIYLFYSYVTDFVKMWLLMWGILNFKPVRIKKIYFIAGNVQLFILIINVFIYKINRDIATFILVFTVVLMTAVIFEGKYLKRLSCSLLSYVLILFLDACITGFGSLLANMSAYEFIKFSIIPYIFSAFNIITAQSKVLIKK